MWYFEKNGFASLNELDSFVKMGTHKKYLNLFFMCAS